MFGKNMEILETQVANLIKRVGMIEDGHLKYAGVSTHQGIKNNINDIIKSIWDLTERLSKLEDFDKDESANYELEKEIAQIRDTVQAGFEKLQTEVGDGRADRDDLERHVYEEIAKRFRLHEKKDHDEGGAKFNFGPTEDEKVANLLTAKDLIVNMGQMGIIGCDSTQLIYDALEYAETLIK